MTKSRASFATANDKDITRRKSQGIKIFRETNKKLLHKCRYSIVVRTTPRKNVLRIEDMCH